MTQRTVENSFEKFELGNSNKSGDVKMLDMSGNDVISSISKSNIWDKKELNRVDSLIC